MNDYEQNQDYYRPPEHSGMETASVILGILGIVGSACCYVAIPLGAIGVLLALLSRGAKMHMSSRAKAGLGLSAACMLLSAFLTFFALYNNWDLITSPDFRQKMQDYLDYYYEGVETENRENFLDDFFNDDQEADDELSPYDDTLPYRYADPYTDTLPYTNPLPGGNYTVEPGPEI